jgi:tetratricopeptide (TPR) repeat protein
MAVEGSPRKIIIINSWAKAFAAQGDYDGAISKLKHSLSIDDRIGAIYYTLGEIYANMNKMEDAIAAYRKGITVDEPDNGEALATLGYLYFKEGKVKEASDASLKAISINPDIVKAHSLLGLIYYKSGRLNEAVDENLKVVKLSPNNPTAHRNLAIIYDQLGQTGNAVKHLEKLIALSPESEKPALAQTLEHMRAKTKGQAAVKPGAQQR